MVLTESYEIIRGEDPSSQKGVVEEEEVRDDGD